MRNSSSSTLKETSSSNVRNLTLCPRVISDLIIKFFNSGEDQYRNCTSFSFSSLYFTSILMQLYFPTLSVPKDLNNTSSRLTSSSGESANLLFLRAGISEYSLRRG